MDLKDLITNTVSASDLAALDLILWECQVAMVVDNPIGHPEIMFLETQVCCSIINGTAELISETDRRPVAAKYPEGYREATILVAKKA